LAVFLILGAGDLSIESALNLVRQLSTESIIDVTERFDDCGQSTSSEETQIVLNSPANQ
tara:strand:+ start:109 stop:285 length:177 start_codon:yes stop_codon:yes gene_type:complete